MTAPHRTLILAAALAVVAAARPARAQTPPGDAAQPHAAKGIERPDGNGCSGEIARWQADEGAGGGMDLKRYNEIQNDTVRAATLCEAGRDAEAREVLSDAKRPHGAP